MVVLWFLAGVAVFSYYFVPGGVRISFAAADIGFRFRGGVLDADVSADRCAHRAEGRGGVVKDCVKRQVVLVFQGAFCQTNRIELDGIFRYAAKAGWTIQTIEYDTAAASRLHEKMSRRDYDAKPLIAFWKPAGCIVECSGQKSKFEIRDFGRIPTVFLDQHPSVIGNGAVCVSSDASSIAECAAKELLPLGFLHYAYLPWSPETVWSRERQEAFSCRVRMNGKKMHVFSGKAKMSEALKYRKELSAWMASLPKPCGVFAANDYLAEQVLSTCAAEGIAVPDEVAVLGVDDEVQICENTKPTLSSIRTDNENAGYMAAELLAKRMEYPRAKVPSRVFGALGVTRRASTRRFPNADRRVVKALEFIRRHACEGIEPPAVVAEMGCSRSLADLRFREMTGHTILDEIHAVRLARVKELASNPQFDIAALPDFCGYASLSDLYRVFRRRVGMTLRHYRNRQ